MKIIVLGGDGFCGWATALHLSKHGHHITIVDNFSRRHIDVDIDTQSVTPIRTLAERVVCWRELTGTTIDVVELDVARDYDGLLNLVKRVAPEAIVHFAEQRAAPYSMKDDDGKRYTVSNNVNGTTAVLTAIASSGLKIHLVHLGTMGVYGYGSVPDTIIPEGYVTVDLHAGADGTDRKTLEILHPAYPGSIYHTTKCLDAILFQFYNKNDGLQFTDLHLGIVWGYATEETAMDERLINRLDVDQYYGTVLNRFLLESVCGHPLTIYGTGGQTRAFIHIQDTVKCVRLAVENPPAAERVRIFNQIAETRSVKYLAERIKEWFGADINYIENPRKELAENTLEVENAHLKSLGWTPIMISREEFVKIYASIDRYKDRIKQETIHPTHKW